MKKRILRLLPVLLAMVLVFGSSLTVFAAENTESCYYANRQSLIIPDGTEYVFADIVVDGSKALLEELQSNSSYSKYVIVSYSPTGSDQDLAYDILFYSSDASIYSYTYYSSGSNLATFKVTSGDIYKVRVVYKYYDTDVPYCIVTKNIDAFRAGSSSSVALELLKGIITCSTHEVYTSSDCTSVFMNAPIPMNPAVIYRKVDQEMMSGALKEIIAILPICLACLVGYLALRKALAFLQNLLSQA